MKSIDGKVAGPDREEMGPLFLLCCLIMLPKVDYVLITSLFVCLDFRMSGTIAGQTYKAMAELADRHLA